MKQQVKITILKTDVDKELAEKYAIPNFEPRPFHTPARFFSATATTSRKACASTPGSP